VVTDHHIITLDAFTRVELEQMVIDGDKLAEAYPDGVMYTIWKQGVLRKFGNRMYMISRVRRESLSVTNEPLEVV
jgi:hypothetical protein